jgi:hypothetical protein
MAAEMSTGALAMAHLYKKKPAVSMLVVKVEGEFFKKADGITTFTCEDGKQIQAAIEKSVACNEPQSIRVPSTGRNTNGDVVAEFFITWSFKARQNK